MGLIMWRRGDNFKLSANFSSKEFNCTCGICADQKVDTELLDRLEHVRADINAPIQVASGYRCQRKQDMLRAAGYETAKGISTHQLGQAADIKAADYGKLLEAVDKEFNNVGVATTWLHVDIRPQAAVGAKRRWWYK